MHNSVNDSIARRPINPLCQARPLDLGERLVFRGTSTFLFLLGFITVQCFELISQIFIALRRMVSYVYILLKLLLG